MSDENDATGTSPEVTTPPDTSTPAPTSNETATATATATAKRADRVVAWLGDANSDRPAPSLGAALSGIGGALAAFGLMVVVLGDDPGRSGFVMMGAVLLVVGYVVRLLPTPAPAKAAAVGFAVVGIPTLALALTVDDGTGTFITGALLAALCLGAWALPGYRNTHILLGLGALALVAAFGNLTAPDKPDAPDYSRVMQCDEYMSVNDYDAYDNANCDEVYNDYYDSMYEVNSTFLPSEIIDSSGESGEVYLGGAALFFGLTWWLDRRGRRGPGAALCTAGLLSAISGAILLATDLGDTSGPLLVAVIGIVVCIVGTHGARRATTWWGAAMASVGAVWLFITQIDPDDATGTGGSLILTGAVLMAIAAVAVWAQRRIPDEPSA